MESKNKLESRRKIALNFSKRAGSSLASEKSYYTKKLKQLLLDEERLELETFTTLEILALTLENIGMMVPQEILVKELQPFLSIEENIVIDIKLIKRRLLSIKQKEQEELYERMSGSMGMMRLR